MACFVKLEFDCYVLWSKAGDCPAERKLYRKHEVLEQLQNNQQTLQQIGKEPPLSVEQLMEWLEKNGTTDLGKSVNKDFIAQYNSLGPQGQTLSINEIIKLLK